jgi:hypothetical protein
MEAVTDAAAYRADAGGGQQGRRRSSGSRRHRSGQMRKHAGRFAYLIQPLRVSHGCLQMIPNVHIWLVLTITLMTCANGASDESDRLALPNTPRKHQQAWTRTRSKHHAERSVNRRLSLRWFEPITCHHQRKRPVGWGFPTSRAVVLCVILCHPPSGDVTAPRWLRTHSGRNRG